MAGGASFFPHMNHQFEHLVETKKLELELEQSNNDNGDDSNDLLHTITDFESVFILNT
jgi:hypothetical protein